MHAYQYVKFHRRRSMVRSSTGPDFGLSRSEESSSTSAETKPNPVNNPKIPPKRSSSAAARVITVRPCSRSITLLSMSNSEAGSIEEDVLQSSTNSYSSPFDRSRSSSVAPIQSRTNSSQSMRMNLPLAPMRNNVPGHSLRVFPFLTISSVSEASDEQFLCDNKISFIINLTGDKSRFFIRNRCQCGKADSIYHNGRQQKLPVKITPSSSPEIINFIQTARKNPNSNVLVFNESGENEVECIAIVYMMAYYKSERDQAESHIVKVLSQNPRRDGSVRCSMSIETRGLLELWNTELKRRAMQQLAGDVSQLNFTKVGRKVIKQAWP